MAADEINYIQHESRAYPKDVRWLAMQPVDRGIYHSLIIFLGCNGGKLENDVAFLSQLCNCTEELFLSFWDRYKRKFVLKNNRISHKRVTSEIEKARKSFNDKRIAGKKSAAKRASDAQQKSNGVATGGQLTKTKAKDKEKVLELNKLAIQFDDKITRLYGPLTNTERVTFSKIRSFLISLSDLEKMETAIAWIAECSRWGADHDKNSVEVKKCFVAKIKKNLNWKP